MSKVAKENPKMSVMDAIIAYPNEWILMDLIDRQDDVTASVGKIMAHKATLKSAAHTAGRFEKNGTLPSNSDAFIFQAVRLPTYGDHFRNTLRAVIDEGLKVGRELQ